MARSRGGKHGSRVRERAAACAAGLLLAGTLAGCTADPPTTTPPPPTGPEDDVALRVTTVGGGGQLTPGQRAQVEADVGEVVSSYLVGGFLGDYPRQRFVPAFADFTPGAAGLATEDIEVLTNARLGDATEVRPRTLDTRLFLMVDDGTVLGATAYVDVELAATMSEGETRRVTLDGRLMLQQQRGRWSVFGFDLAHDDGAPVGGGAG